MSSLAKVLRIAIPFVCAAASALSCAPASPDGPIPAKANGSGGNGDGKGDGTGTTPSPTATTAPTTSPTTTPPVTPKNNGFPTKWIDGTACSTDPQIQTWKFTDDTYILRQSLCTNFEGPFLYLMIGKTKALLVDTGTGGVDLAGEVNRLIAGKNVQLVVAHSHSHGDHVGGDGAFRNQPNTTVVSTQTAAAQSFFGITGDAPSSFDLGSRVIDVLAIPGHQAAHLAFYDHETQLLLTGDTLYPGRLYIDDWNSYRTSVPRLVAFVDAQRPVSYIVGGHIEMPKTGADFAYGAQQHPNEHVLQLGDAELRELSAAVQAMGNTPTRQVHTSFIISP
jgi:glyoxylase-like metal-dependent hydrolase (beta-lactamase superfamily II)